MSTNISENIAVLVLKHSNWNHYSSIDQYPYWELREAISYLDERVIRSELTSGQNSKVDTIVEHIRKSKDHTWLALTIFEEALIQHCLRNKNIAIKCAEMNDFPTNTQELTKFLEVNRSENYKTYIGKGLTLIDKYKIAAMFYFTIGYIILNFSLPIFIASIAVAWVVHFSLQILEHDYYSHRYIIPKNNFLTKVFGAIMRLSLGSPENFRLSHIHHHHYWNQDEDILGHLIRSGKWSHLVNCTKYNLVTNHNITNRLDVQGQKQVDKSGPISRFVSKYYSYVITAICLAVGIIFGLSATVYFCFVPMLAHIIGGNLPDAAMYILKRQEDFPFLYPLMLRDAYHYDHHIRYRISDFNSIDDMFSKQGKLKYLSFEYYFMKLFFKYNN